jgi:hypothetical protein
MPFSKILCRSNFFSNFTMAKGTVSQKEGEIENHVMRKYIFFYSYKSNGYVMFVIYNKHNKYVDGRVEDSVHMTEGRTVLIPRDK